MRTTLKKYKNIIIVMKTTCQRLCAGANSIMRRKKKEVVKGFTSVIKTTRKAPKIGPRLTHGII